MTTQKQGVLGYIYVDQGHLREEVGQAVCEMKEEIRNVVVRSDIFQETTKVTLITLKLALEPLLTFALEFAHTEGQHDTTLTITPVAVDYILDSNCKTMYSTRPIRRFIKCSIVTELSKLITQGG